MAAKQELSFTEETHEYKLGHHVVPSVTQTIRNHIKGWSAGEFYLQKGRAAHRAIQLYLDDKLDWDTVDERIKGRIEACIRFMSDTGMKPIGMEIKLASRRYQYAGTVDLYGKSPVNGLVVADWKASVSPEVQIQLGSYWLLMQETGMKKVDMGCAVETFDTGKYKLKWFTKRELQEGANIFLAMLTIANWKRKHNIKDNNGN